VAAQVARTFTNASLQVCCGKEILNRPFGTGRRAATGKHRFARLCADPGIGHRPAPPVRPHAKLWSATGLRTK